MSVIYCFSATGNSLFAAQKIAEVLDAPVLPMTAENAGLTCREDVIGFVFPTYFLNLPYQVEAFVSRLAISGTQPYIFAIATYNSHAGAVLGALQELLQKKGLSLSYGAALQAVGTYLPLYPPNNTIERQELFEVNLVRTAEEILLRTTNKTTSPGPKENAARLFFPARNPRCDEKFYVSDACDSCGVCQLVCPAGNIRVEEGEKPVFLHHCQLCLGCVHWCPRQAIDWNGKTQRKPRYHHPQVSLATIKEFWAKNNQ